MIGVEENSQFFVDSQFPLFISPHSTSVIRRIEDQKSLIHEAIEIKYFYEGRSTLLIGNEAVVANAGDVIVMNPYEIHATLSCSEERGKYHLIMVGLDFFPTMPEWGGDLRTLLFSQKKAFVHRISDLPELNGLLDLLVREWTEKKQLYRLRLRGLMMEILTLLFRYGMTDTPASGSVQRLRYHATVEPALRIIRDAYSSDLTLDALAEACCINKYHFCRIFKEAMGTSPMQYLCDYRLNSADVLLRNTEKSLADILSDCGFHDESYFYRSYRKHFGISPKERRKKNRT